MCINRLLNVNVRIKFNALLHMCVWVCVVQYIAKKLCECEIEEKQSTIWNIVSFVARMD